MKGSITSVQNFVVKPTDNESTVDLLLYGYIGEDYWSEEPQNTDISFASTLNELGQKYNRINIRINSPGGSIYHGNAIVNAIRSSKAEIHTYNDGLAASMAAVIFCAAEYRHMADNALLMFHSPLNIVWGNAKDMRDNADFLDVYATTLIPIIAKAQNKTNEEVKAAMFDYADHWIGYDEASKLMLTNAFNEKYEAPAEQVSNSILNYNQLTQRAGDQIGKVAAHVAAKHTIVNEVENQNSVEETQELHETAPEVNDELTAQLAAKDAEIENLRTQLTTAQAAVTRQTVIGAKADNSSARAKDPDMVKFDAYNAAVSEAVDHNPNFKFD